LGDFVVKICCFALAFGIATTACAQPEPTPEETFAYITFNLQDGDSFKTPGDGVIAISRTATKPLTYKMGIASGGGITFVIKEDSKCVFDVEFDLGQDGVGNAKFDMNQLIGLWVNSEKPKLMFANECAVKIMPANKCIGGNYTIGEVTNPNVDIARMSRAVNYFKKAVCGGSPY
jgi:hypothetical protein